MSEYTAYPADRHDLIKQSLDLAPSGGLSLDLLIGLDGGTFRLGDASPHSFLQLVPPAIGLSNYLPTFDLPDSPPSEKSEANLTAKAEDFLAISSLGYIMPDIILDAAAYGCSYVAIYDDGIRHLRHNQVELAGEWPRLRACKLLFDLLAEDASSMDITLTDADEQSGHFELVEVWDCNAHTLTRSYAGKDIAKEAWPIDTLPVLRLEFGATPADITWPYGLILPWLPVLAELTYYRSLLAVNINEAVMAPTFISAEYLKETERGIEYDFYGKRVIAVSDAFFVNNQGKVFKPQVEQLSSDFYAYLQALSAKLNETSHLSDLLRAQQLRANITAAEVQAIQQSQTIWLSTQREIVRVFVEKLWQVWAEYSGITTPLYLDVPDVDPTSTNEKLKKATFLMQLSQSPIGSALDPKALTAEITKLLGVQSIVAKPPEAPHPSGKQETPQGDQNTAPTNPPTQNPDKVLLANLQQVVGARAPEIYHYLSEQGLLDQVQGLSVEQLTAFLNQLRSQQAPQQ